MPQYTQDDYDASIALHNHAAQRRRYAASEYLSGRMTDAQYIAYANAEQFALHQWETIRAALYPGT